MEEVLQKFSLDGKIALVTGCSRGIGKAMAIGLAEAGADIIGVSGSLKERGSQIEEEIVRRGKRFWSFQCNFSDRTDLYQFISDVEKNHSQIDILVSNAGTFYRSPAADHHDAEWDRVMEVNLNSHFILARELGKRMIQRGHGKIIFIASLLTFQGGIMVPSYAASKGAIGQLTMALANEWAGKGVNVNAIAPGYIKTEMTDVLQKDPIRSKSILERIPQGRWGEPEDFKGPVVFLASEASNYMNGSIMIVDGGWMAR